MALATVPTTVAAGCPAAAALVARLEVSADRKTSPRVRVRAGKSDAYPNAFGLPAGPPSAGGSCADTTEFCRSCYAARTERQWSTVARKMARNLSALRACGDSHVALVNALDSMLAGWYVDAVAAGVARTFRIHWDGDFFSEAYAAAWRAIVGAYPDVEFWCYTRAVWAVPILVGAPNLKVYASVDQYNAASWAPVLADYPTVLVAACADTFDHAQDLVISLGRRRAPACPEGRRLPLVVGPSGRGSDVPGPGDIGRGACDACRVCIDGRSDIRFATQTGRARFGPRKANG